MNKELIEKYSVIIAEFMGVKIVKRNGENAVYMYENAAFPEYFRCTKYNTYHTDWNEIYKVVKKLVNVDTSSFTFEQFDYICDRINLVQFYFISHSDEHTSYDAFISIGEAIEYLNTIKQITQ